MQSAAAPQPWGIVVLEDHEPALVADIHRYTPDGAAELLVLLDSALATLDGIRSDAERLARLPAPSEDPVTRALAEGLGASAHADAATAAAQRADLTGLRDEVTAALRAYQARTGRAAG